MRIGSALLTAAMMVSGIVVIVASPASAQTYAPSGYQTGYQSGYRPAYQPTYQTGYRGGGSSTGGYVSRDDGYTGYVRPANATVVYEDATVGYTPAPRYGYDARPVATPVYEQPVYEAPRYVAPVRPTYVTQTYTPPRYVAPVEQCHERGW